MQEEKRRRAKKVPFQIPEGREISRNVKEKIEARRKSQAYALEQRKRGMQKKDQDAGGVLGCDNIWDLEEAGAGRSASTGAALQRQKKKEQEAAIETLQSEGIGALGKLAAIAA